MGVASPWHKKGYTGLEAWSHRVPHGEQARPVSWGYTGLCVVVLGAGAGMGSRESDSGASRRHQCQLWGPLSSSPNRIVGRCGGGLHTHAVAGIF